MLLEAVLLCAKGGEEVIVKSYSLTFESDNPEEISQALSDVLDRLLEERKLSAYSVFLVDPKPEQLLRIGVERTD